MLKTAQLTKRDWLLILVFAEFFGTSKGYFYYAASHEIVYLWLSATIPFFAWLFSYILVMLFNKFFVSLSNKTRAFFLVSISAFAGFLGIETSMSIFYMFGISIRLPYEISIATAVLCVITSFIFYRFVYLRNEKDRMEKIAAKAELNSTQMQLNPHFLFNSINTLSELIYQDQAKCERMLLCISDLLRQMTNFQHIITLGEEIEFGRRYIQAQNFRFDDSIKLNIDDYFAIKDVILPKYSVSLLLENSVKHKNADGLAIDISFKQDGKNIQICVSDNNVKKDVVFGFGLQNLQERLISHRIGTLNFRDNMFLIEVKQ